MLEEKPVKILTNARLQKVFVGLEGVLTHQVHSAVSVSQDTETQ